MSLENLLELHKNVARSAGCVIDGEGRLFHADGETPITANKTQYILPTQKFLQAGTDEYLPFYLIGEDINTAESQVLQTARTLMVLELTTRIFQLVSFFIQMGSDHDSHSTLTVRQKAVLKHVAKADEETFKTWEKIGVALSSKGVRMLVKFYQKFQGKIESTSYSRVCSVSFPILDELDVATDNKNKVFGVTCRVMDIKMFTDVLYYILGESAAQDGYFSRGSNDLTAPYFVSLSMSYIAVANTLNPKLKLFGLDQIDTSWEDELTTLAQYRGLIPAGLPGTVGQSEAPKSMTPKRPVIGLQQEAMAGNTTTVKNEPEPTQVITTNRVDVQQPKTGYGTYQPKQYVAAEPQIVHSAPMYQTQNNHSYQQPVQQKATGNKVSWEDAKRLKASQPVQQQQVVYTTNNVQQAAPQFVQVGVDQYGRPVFQPAQQIQQQVVHTTNTAPQSHAGSQLAINTDPNAYFQPNAQQTHGGTTYYQNNGGYTPPGNGTTVYYGG